MISKNNSLLKICTALLFSLTLTLTHTHSSATTVTQCKGESQDACEQRIDCRWIDAHKRKNGAAVKAYCRSKAKPKSTAQKILPATDNSAEPSKNISAEQPASDGEISPGVETTN